MKRNHLIITDSGCDIPPELETALGIDVLPFSILIDDKEYLERVDLSPQKFYALATVAATVPKTTQLKTELFYKKFKSCEKYETVFVVLINATGSATYANADAALKQIRAEGLCPNTDIRLFDGRAYSISYGYPLVEAAKKLIRGCSPDEVAAYLEDMFSSLETYILAFDLKFAKKSGRINAAAAFLGEMMGLKPIISLIDGVSHVEKKCRGEKILLPEAVEYISSRSIPDTPWLLLRTTVTPQEDEFLRIMSKRMKAPPAMVSYAGCAVGANSGPKIIGVIIKGKDRGKRNV
ncbi:MAG: DegV family EDD domain-containing protein [Oscillospiraceae bacterium]|jgi:DegV family protein with EDD domain|nr:DegV family EDD domain-containing protein [Oscillospiraceae bacterium]